MLEEDIPDDRDLAEQGHLKHGQTIGASGQGTELLAVNIVADPVAEYDERHAGDNLVGAQGHCENSDDKTHEHAGCGSRQETEPLADSRQGSALQKISDQKAGDAAHDHHAVKTQVHDAGALGHNLPEGGEQHWHSKANGSSEKRNYEGPVQNEAPIHYCPL